MTPPLRELEQWARTVRGARERGLRESVMSALKHMNSSNFGMALQALHDAIVKFDAEVQGDFAAQDELIREAQTRRLRETQTRRRKRRRRRGK